MPRVQRVDLVVGVEASEGVDEMRADLRIDVLHVVLAITGSVRRPALEVADHLVGRVGDSGGRSWGGAKVRGRPVASASGDQPLIQDP